MPRVHPGGGSGGGGYGATGHSYGAGGLTVAYAATELTADVADAAAAVPDDCLLSSLDLAIDTVAGGAAALSDVYLSEDAAGLYPLSHPVDVTWIESATVGHYVATVEIDRVYHLSDEGTAGSVFPMARTDVGTCNIVARLRWV
jgi:hypothetical protein